MAAALGAAFTTAVRVVDRVHCGAADVGANALPPIAARLADHHIHRVGVADLADRRPAISRDAANFSAGQSDLSPTCFAGHERGGRAGGSAEASTASGLHLDA